MNAALSRSITAFDGHTRLISGPYVEVALAVKTATDAGVERVILSFDDATGAVVDFDLRGTKADMVERLMQTPPPQPVVAPAPGPAQAPPEDDAPRPRGRPKLGVVAREVTLLPRHWQWLGAQPGGASAALRRLVEAARRAGGAKDEARAAQEAAYRFMSAVAGDLPGYEEATRALFADDLPRFEHELAPWPQDVREYTLMLAQRRESA